MAWSTYLSALWVSPWKSKWSAVTMYVKSRLEGGSSSSSVGEASLSSTFGPNHDRSSSKHLTYCINNSSMSSGFPAWKYSGRIMRNSDGTPFRSRWRRYLSSLCWNRFPVKKYRASLFSESDCGCSLCSWSKKVHTDSSSSSVRGTKGAYVSKSLLCCFLPMATRLCGFSACCGGSHPQMGIPSGCIDVGKEQIVDGRAAGSSAAPSAGGLPDGSG
mmetsp:Transcript_23502/g.65852  ORF Transcript_23502/g.65852 Transcript_23502/m.65852 type:complete len:216 (-) Transcript_23502:1006-1653(-)